VLAMRFLGPILFTCLLAISAISVALPRYNFFGIWQRKPAIDLLTHQWPDRARGSRVDSEILR
jgi:hypothetical protein